MTVEGLGRNVSVSEVNHHCVLRDKTEWSYSDAEVSHPHADMTIQLGACWLYRKSVSHSIAVLCVELEIGINSSLPVLSFPFWMRNKLNEYIAGLVRGWSFHCREGIVVFWDMSPCCLVGGYHAFCGTYCLRLQVRRWKRCVSLHNTGTVPAWQNKLFFSIEGIAVQ